MTPTPGETPRDVLVLRFLHHELVLVDADAWTFYNNPGMVFFTRGLRNGNGLPKSRMQIHKLTEFNLVHFLNSSLSYAAAARNSTMTSLGTGASNSKKQGYIHTSIKNMWWHNKLYNHDAHCTNHNVLHQPDTYYSVQVCDSTQVLQYHY